MLTFIYSDAAVVRKVLQGNQGIFRVLVDRYAGVVHSVAYAHLRNSDDAEDITQETFTRFYQQLDRVAHYRQVGPWLVSVARNVSVDLLRKRVRETAMAKSAGAARTSEQNPAREELHRILWEQLDALNGEAREVLILHYFMHKKAREIGALLGITPETATKRVQRAREELGRRLTDLLGEEIDEIRTDARRSERIMAAVCAMPVAWKSSAAGAAASATAAGVATGVGAAKLALGAGAVVIAAIVALLAYDRYAAPSSASVKPASVAKAAGAPDVPAPVPEADAEVAGNVSEAAKADETGAAVESEAGVGTGEAWGCPIVKGTVSGTVTLEDGRPAAGAEVSLDNDQWVKETAKLLTLQPLEPVSVSVVADNAGRYRIDGVALTNTSGGGALYRLSGRLGNLYGERPYLNTSIVEREAVQDLVLKPDLSLGGIVMDYQGKPIKDVIVISNDQPTPTGFLMRRTDTGENGRFLLQHMQPEPTRLELRKRGCLTFRTEPLAVGVTNHVLRMALGNSISGRAVNAEDGSPVAGAVVLAQCEDKSSKWGYADTDEQGQFKLTGCIPGAYTVSVTFKKENPTLLTLPAPVKVNLGTAPVQGVELKLVTGAIVRGKVIDDETGLCIRGPATVEVSGEDKTAYRNGRVDDSGSYELLGMPAGTLTLKVFSFQGRFSGSREGGMITIAKGEKSKTHDIHLATRPFIAGTVVDEQGAPVGGASVYGFEPENPENFGAINCEAVSDLSGKFRLVPTEHYMERIAKTGVLVQARNESGFSQPDGPYFPDKQKSDVVLRLMTQGWIKGEVVNREGRPLDHARVCAFPESGQEVLISNSRRYLQMRANFMKSVNMQVQPDGTFESPLQPGAYRLEACLFSSPQGEFVESTVTIQAGRTSNTRIVLDTSDCGSIEGHVSYGGEPMSGARICVRPVNAYWSDWVWQDVQPNGDYEVRNLMAGEVKVKLVAYPSPVKQFEKEEIAEVVAGGVTEVDFEIVRGEATAEGVVTYNGAPAADLEVAFVPLDPENKERPRARTDEKGFYRADQLPEGAYTVEAAKVTYGGWVPMRLAQAVEAQLTANQTARLDFELLGGEIAGTVSGLKEGETTFIALFPGDAVLTVWTVEALEALGERLMGTTFIEKDGPFAFNNLQEGHYLVAAVALGPGVAPELPAFVSAPVALGEAMVTAGQTAEVGLELPAH
ncbi:MAG: sigma-70 family RNA polymerase sigma factor [Candidatus Hydrogenedentes bacterium]|nr:sigma-70 family RNA polymerase sigma factor [Candidatus Hydrogenedentota bacterium]